MWAYNNTKKMNWIILILAGLFEVGFTSSLVKAEQHTGTLMWLWYGAFMVSLTLSMLFLIIASKTIPMGTAYAVFAGIGAVGTVLVGIFVFKDTVSFWKLFFIITLIGSIIGLKLIK